MTTYPDISADVFVAPTATIVGAVTIGPGSSVWFGAVIRGDEARITIGSHSNIQDNCVIHCDQYTPATLGDRVSVGHGAVIHGCNIGDDCIIGINSVLLNGCRIGSGSVIGAGAVVKEGMEVPAGSLVVGVPARVIREGDSSLLEAAEINAGHYDRLVREHRAGKWGQFPEEP